MKTRNLKAKKLGVDDPFSVNIYRFVSYGSQKQSSQPVFKEFPGAYGQTDDLYSNSSRLASQMEKLIGKGTGSSLYSDPLQKAILNPSFNPDTASEQALISSLLDLTEGKSAVRGLGPATQSELMSGIAPTLVGLRQQDIQNMTGARGQDLTMNGAQMQALLELIGYSMPQLMGGTSSSGRSGNYGLGGSIAF